MPSKNLIRSKLLQKRLALDPKTSNDWSRVIQQSVLCSEEYLKATRIALYHSFKNETRTDDIFNKALRDKKEVYFPQWNPTEAGIHFYLVQRDTELQPTPWGTREPVSREENENRELDFDLIIVPGLAFDLQANRLGYGYGGYDRLLRRARGPAWGLAFDLQVVDTLPTTPHDVPCQQVITEARIIKGK